MNKINVLLFAILSSPLLAYSQETLSIESSWNAVENSQDLDMSSLKNELQSNKTDLIALSNLELPFYNYQGKQDTCILDLDYTIVKDFNRAKAYTHQNTLNRFIGIFPCDNHYDMKTKKYTAFVNIQTSTKYSSFYSQSFTIHFSFIQPEVSSPLLGNLKISFVPKDRSSTSTSADQ